MGILGGLVLGIAGAGLCMLAFGSDSGTWALLLLWVGGIALAIAAPDLLRATRRLLISAGLAVLLLVFVSALISDRLLPGVGRPLQAASHREDTIVLLLGMLLGGLTLFAGLWVGRDPRNPAQQLNRPDDVTDNFVGSHAERLTKASDQRAARPRPMNRKLPFTLLSAALVMIAIIVWSNQDEGMNSGGEQPVHTAAPPAPIDPAPASEAVAEPVASELVAPPSLPSASQVRRECMAQVEAARLFLAHVHASASRGDYEVKIRADMERLQREKPVGPRTLTLISSAMWSRRETPDPDPVVWTREYTRCEQVRSTGTFYVVRAQN